MHKKIIMISSITILIIVGLFVWRYFEKDGSQSISDIFEEKSKPEVLIPAINGVLVKEDIASRRPIGVVIENHPDSRPQTGLDKANVVYETLAEGGITRFLALYQTADESQIGPVRSARDYFAEVANEYQSVFAHVGGSDEALANLAAKKYTGVDDANQYFLDSYFMRVKNRFAPHNVYTKLSLIRALIADKEWRDAASLPAWQFSNEPAAGTEPAQQATMKFSTPGYTARFDFDPATNMYKRFMAGSPHLDAETKQQLTAKTVIAQIVDVSATPNDPKLRIDIDLTSGGHAYIFYGGTVTHAMWKRINNRTRYYGVDGNELQFPRGQMWICLVPSNAGSVTWE